MWKKKPKIEMILGPGTQLEGIIHSEGILRIDGFLNGGVAIAQEVLIGKTGKVKGDIKAKTVAVSGNVTGNITALNSIKMLPNAEVYGDIETKYLSILPGATFQGNCTMKKEKTKVIDIEKRKEE